MSNINLELLTIFNEVAEKQSISKASENLFISQPAVSQSIKKLETELGGLLFYRSNKGIKLTEEGECFYRYVKDALEIIQKGQDEFENFRQFNRGTINIGISTTLTKLVLVEVLTKFHKDYPNVKINIYNDLSKNLVEDLQYGKLDFVIVNTSSLENRDFEKIKITSFNHAFIYNPDFYNFNKTLNLNDLQNIPVILQKYPANTRTQLDKFLQDNNIQLNVKTEVVSQELIKVFSQSGLGVGYVIEEMLNLKEENLQKLKLNEKLPKCDVFLLKNMNKSQSFASKEFIKYIKDEFKF